MTEGLACCRVDYAVFHSPFNRMTRKAVATLADADSRRC